MSSADLLDILSNGNNPTAVAKHLTKLFDSMAALKFEKVIFVVIPYNVILFYYEMFVDQNESPFVITLLRGPPPLFCQTILHQVPRKKYPKNYSF